MDEQQHAVPSTPSDAVEGGSAPGGFEARLVDENEAIAARRREAFPDGLRPATRIGLALSGGGIRSATFSLGLVRGLAANGLLRRFDYLSTVSGGGFTGGMLGRLIGSVGIDRAEKALARTDSLVMWWLRRNGRYLSPGGSRDLGMAVVTFLRAWLAVHIEFAFVALLIGVAVVLPHLVQNEWGWIPAATWPGIASAWWIIAALVWLGGTPGAILSYWIARDGSDARAGQPATRAGPGARDAFVLVVLAALTAWAAVGVVALDAGLMGLAAMLAAGGALVRYIGTFLRVRGAARDADGVARERNRLTRALRRWSVVAAVLFGIGVLDAASWQVNLMLARTGGSTFWTSLSGGLGLTGVALIVLRALAEPLQKLESAATASRLDWRSRALNLLGLALAGVLVLGWASLVQWFVFAGPPVANLDDWGEPARAGVVAAVAILWLALTARHAQTANASSLHSFYRARLVRAWLSVGNPARFASGHAREAAAGGATAVPPDERNGETVLDAVHSVTDVIPGDDIDLGAYRPEARGGPIHLVNTCLNQTRDDTSDLYNADRKGCMLTVGARGFEWGRDAVRPLDGDASVGTLGRWVAISGAAASPGAGSYTSSGWAMTLFFLGVRLGYWLRRPFTDATTMAAKDTWAWRALPKVRLLLAEARARYGGLRQPWWYLSDGGHFENTGVYPLLRRRLDLIVLSDAGADPAFEFGDLDNLVRKARIDFGAEIEFHTHADAVERFGLDGDDLTVLSPEDLAANTSARGVLLARIRYRDDGNGPHTGTLVVVKPNLHAALDADVLGYALRHPGFPQQGTGDQFFDEAQWESYQHLGFDLGQQLREDWLAKLPGWNAPAPADAGQLARVRTPVVRVVEREVPFWRRAVPAAALGTTLGIGASGTLLFAAWQAVDQVRKEQAERRDALVASVADAERYLDGLPPTATGIALAARAHAATLVALDRATLPASLQARYDTVIEAFARHCSALDAAPASQGTTLCGATRRVVSDVAPSYWHPSCRSTWARPLDLRGCEGQLPTQVAVAPVVSPTPEPLALPTPESPPVPVAAPSPIAATTTASRLPACLDERGITVYTQVYDEATREAVVARVAALLPEAQARKRMPGVENVVRSAERRGANPPTRWRKPTLLVHDPADRACAEALVRAAGPAFLAPGSEVAVRALPPTLRATPRVLELWLPPGSVATTP
ncbi:patatin-like phospholipase family protein [Dokdonella sp. MW10]|uniref:patatin-like phospholipase family protein n=1 Tax=Dokdonella sp. MW10 TaxID=2992926 RepID=UPI003F803FB5